MEVLDIVIANNSIKRAAELQKKAVASHKKHVENTIGILTTNIEFLKFAVSGYDNSEKYDYLYNIVANKYSFKMADDVVVDKFLLSHGIYRKAKFESKKSTFFNIAYALIVVATVVLSYVYTAYFILAGFALCVVFYIIFSLLRSSFLERRNFYKVNPEYVG